MYRTTAQASSRRLHLVARVVGDPAAAIPETQQAIRALDPDTPLTDAGTMSTLMRESEADDRFRAILMRTFAALAALLASFEVFGVTARAVSARAREIGIRTALGARTNGLIVLVLRDGLISATVGIGLIGATWTAGAIRHLLHDLDARDPLTYAVVVVFAVAFCLVAAYLPARRVTSITPMEVMADD